MCGIIGIVGKSPVAGRLVESLKRLEYRGYDSAGVAAQVNGVLERRRAPGKPAPDDGRAALESWSRARSAEVTMMAPPPSVTRQQSRTVRGVESMGAANACSMVMGSFSQALGFISAHCRAATTTSASCSRVVP